MVTYSRRARRYYGRKRSSRSRWYRFKFSRKSRRRRYRKRRYKRMLNKKEVKFKAAPPLNWYIRPHLVTVYSSENPTTVTEQYIRYSPAFGLGVGSCNTNLEQISWPFYGFNIDPGYLSDQRIGQKINVKKYTVKGTFTLVNAKSSFDGIEGTDNKFPNYNSYSYQMDCVSGWVVRVIMMKCKAGDTQYALFTQGYNQIMPNPTVNDQNLRYPFGNWIKRIIPEWLMGNFITETQDYPFTAQQIVANTRLKVLPLQEGITDDVTILKNKTYFITNRKPIVNFRISTKRIGQLEWPRVSGKPEFIQPENVQTDTGICTFFICTPMAYIENNIPFLSVSVNHKLMFVDP